MISGSDIIAASIMSSAASSGGAPGGSAVALGGLGGSLEEKDCDLLCPVCFELIEEAYVTRCGHSFCFACVGKAVELHRRCPKCGAALASRDHIFPNFLLNELVSAGALVTRCGHSLAHKAGSCTAAAPSAAPRSPRATTSSPTSC
ncbi:E3 ubiquitin-protein ligase COP1 [Ostrinia nubilalis]|uniref:E3 ubiquitin-protein ligase COP1 n=1 Tax=Ostrinia nubilalis TaxID=29057 RepID=UPI00308264E0